MKTATTKQKTFAIASLVALLFIAQSNPALAAPLQAPDVRVPESSTADREAQPNRKLSKAEKQAIKQHKVNDRVFMASSASLLAISVPTLLAAFYLDARYGLSEPNSDALNAQFAFSIIGIAGVSIIMPMVTAIASIIADHSNASIISTAFGTFTYTLPLGAMLGGFAGFMATLLVSSLNDYRHPPFWATTGAILVGAGAATLTTNQIVRAVVQNLMNNDVE